MFLRAFLILLAGVSPAAAHFGHAGELAGHSHWVALGAAAAAAALAALLAKRRVSDTEEASDVGENDTDEVDGAAS